MRRVGARLKVRMVVFHGAFSQNMQKLPVWKTGFAHFGATSASDRFDRRSVARGIDFDAVGKARLIENRAKIDRPSLVTRTRIRNTYEMEESKKLKTSRG
jgi:hypothetical protein